jgi:hypothetical protein
LTISTKLQRAQLLHHPDVLTFCTRVQVEKAAGLLQDLQVVMNISRD